MADKTKLAAFREANPAYSNVSDDQLTQALYDRTPQYKDAMSIDEFRSQMGMSTTSTGDALYHGATQGATFGFADEAGAFGRAVIDKYVNKLIQPEFVDERPFGEVYGDIRDRSREEYGRVRRERPKTTFAAEMASGVIPGMGAASAATRGAQTLRQAIPGLARAGAAYGGIAGLGHSEADDAGGMAADTAIGAGLGAATGVAVPAAISGAGRVASRVAALRPSQRAAASANRRATSELTQRLDDMGYSPEQAQKLIDDNPGMMLADLIPDEVAHVTTQPGRGAQVVGDALENRNRQQAGRITGPLREALGGDDVRMDFHQVADDAATAMRNQGDELYNIAYAGQARLSGDMQRTMQSQQGQRAVRLADQLIEADRVANPNMEMTPMRYLDYVQRGLHDVARTMQRSKPSLGRQYMSTARRFVQQLEGNNKPYAEARRVWAGARADERARDIGLKVFRPDADELAMITRDMSQSELTNFRIGVMRAVQREFAGKPDTADVARRLREVPRMRDALRAAFGSDEKFNDFLRVLEREQTYTETLANLGTRNSATAKREAINRARGADAGAMAGFLGGAKIPVIGPWLGRMMGRRAGGAIGERVGREAAETRGAMGDLLVRNDPTAIVSGAAKPALPAPGMVTNTAAMTGALMSPKLPGILE